MRTIATLAVLAVIPISAAACGGSQAGTTESGGQKQVLTAKQLIQRFKPAIVRVESGSTRGGEFEAAGVGTGFVVGDDGQIATNLHVIQGNPQMRVVFSDGRHLVVKRVMAYRADYDLAILSVEADDLPTLELGDSDTVSAGEQVYAIGNPLGVFDYTVSDGLISSVRNLSGTRVLQTTAPISVGSSGGPLFNTYGEVIGIATFFAQGGQNLNFAMPSNYLRQMLRSSKPMTVAEFYEETKGEFTRPAPTGPRRHPKVTRNVPTHDVSILADCSADQLAEVVGAMQRAIEIGAPIYNRGEYEACYVVYRNAAEKYAEGEEMCAGIRKAFGDGLLNADAATAPAAKAWAMRDTFDGLLDVIGRKVSSSGP